MDRRELARLVVQREKDPHYWQQELAWLLGEESVGLLAPVCEQGQIGLRFPDSGPCIDTAIAALARRIAPLLGRGTRVCVDLTAVLAQAGDREPALLSHLLQRLTAAVDRCLPRRDDSGQPGRLMFSLPAGLPSLTGLLRRHARNPSARPMIALRVSDDLLSAACPPDSILPGGAVVDVNNAGKLWHSLTDISHRRSDIVLVLQTTTHPSCELAVPEPAEVVMPVSLFEARPETAWLAIKVDIAAFGPCPDRQRFQVLRRALRVGMRLADNLLDDWDWASKALRHDAMVNRRLAVHIVGIGGLVDRCAMDPSSLTTLRYLERWMAVVKQLMVRESIALAHLRGQFPELPVKELVDMLVKGFGSELAGKLVRQRSLRHRHLMVMSPFALFPDGQPRHSFAAYFHLLPVIRFADTIAMYGFECRHRLNCDEYRRLLQMSWAISRNRQ